MYNKIIWKLNWYFRKLLTKLNIKRKYLIGNTYIKLDYNHTLPNNQLRFPYYDRFLPHFVKYLPANSSVVDVAIGGSSNTFDIDWGYAASAERLNLDLDITGGSNVWDINIDSDDVTWDIDVIGSSNNFATTQSDGAYQSITVEWIGSSGDIDILQTSGTCGGSIASCYGIIDADFDSENAVVNIKQTDTSD